MSKEHLHTLADFDYDLPKDLIAQEPANPRDHSRLMVYDRKTGNLHDARFYDLPEFLPSDTHLVLNNSKVEKARMLFGGIEIFVLQTLNETMVEALVKPGKKFKEGMTVDLGEGISAKVVAVLPDGQRRLEFNRALSEPIFEEYRRTPFPPYITPNESLSSRYQTVYAKEMGSKAAPTAGLHFTEDVFARLHHKNIHRTEVTLHVGLGTFAPVKTDRIKDHKLHSEWYSLDEDAAQHINQSGHVTAVGTTSVRVLESIADERGKLLAGTGTTDIFIYPGYKFKRVNALITNFHLPKSTLLMLVSAFIGYEETMRIYRHAVEQGYRFFSFGDAMLLL